MKMLNSCPLCKGSDIMDYNDGSVVFLPDKSIMPMPMLHCDQCGFVFPKWMEEDEPPIEIVSPKGTYKAILETNLPDLSVTIKILDNPWGKLLFELFLDPEKVYLDEVSITDIIFTDDERFMVVVNFYFNPILIYETKNWNLYHEIKEFKDVQTVKVTKDNILLIEEGWDNWVKWNIKEKRKIL